MTRRTPQLSLDLLPQFGWGGRRGGCGRKPKGDRAELPHEPRGEVDGPVHVTMRVRAHVWNLRSLRSWRAVASALRGVQEREGFRVVHYAVLGDHVHLLVEADDSDALARGAKALAIRIAKALNAMMGRRGPVFVDRFHSHSLRTPTEVERALAYVVGNFASHCARRGAPLRDGFVDPFSSAAALAPDGVPPPVSAPRTWLLANAERHRLREMQVSEIECVYLAA